jgi:hypothetical protein
MANAQLNVSFITNRKGEQNIAYNGYIYRQIRKNDDRTFWKCTVDLIGIVTKQILNHINTHCINEVKLIPSIYQEELNKLLDHDWDDIISKTVVQRIPTFNSAKSSLYRARRKQTPALPTTRDDIRLDGKWTEVATWDRFLLFDDSEIVLIFLRKTICVK